MTFSIIAIWPGRTKTYTTLTPVELTAKDLREQGKDFKVIMILPSG